MNEYRITKYNPIYRNFEGNYCNDEWTSYSDIGKNYNGELFAFANYIIVENKYIDAIVSLMNKKTNSMTITGLEKNFDNFDANTSEEMIILYNELKEKCLIDIINIPTLCKLVLREYVWVRLTSPQMFIHFGYDYYMYIGINYECKDILEKIEKSGLFVEQLQSPYKK